MNRIVLWVIFVAISVNLQAQRRKRKNKKDTAPVVAKLINEQNLRQHIQILASDSLQGRRTGTIGEQLASSYIRSQFADIGLLPKGNNGSYLQTFDVFDGLHYENFSTFSINNKPLIANTEYFPINSSANATKEEIVSPALKDVQGIWFLDLKDELVKQKTNIHFDINTFLTEKLTNMQTDGAGCVIVYNSGSIADQLAFDTKTKKAKLKIPVVYVQYAVIKKAFPKNNDVAELNFNIDIREKNRTGTNVIGYINNGAENTVIVGAHYDHLGMGEDKNSLHTGELAIHNGADDNASGVAALLELASALKKSDLKAQNYLFIAFSGEELGLYGSKYFTENPTINLTEANYMINMDMVGRLNDSTKAYTIGGYGTSDVWSTLISQGLQTDGTIIKIDSSGTGPSDHTSFYRKNIPVLFYFTGTHSDYHKPSDDAEKINIVGTEMILNNIYSLIKQTNGLPKLGFLKTREQASGGSSTRFTVSLGIMPDYTFSGGGVKVDGVSEGKLAKKLGIQAGDIVTKLGDIIIDDVNGYMKALSKFKKGDSTTVVTNRAGKEIKYDVSF